MEGSHHRGSVDANVLLSSRFVSGVLVSIFALSRSLRAADSGKKSGNYARLEAAIIDLSRVFYYAEGKGHSATLGEELGFAEQYLRLQALRFEGRLTYRIIVDKQAIACAIPRLVLFDYLERAVAESLELSTENAFILVETSSLENGKLRLKVARGLDSLGPLLEVGVLHFAVRRNRAKLSLANRFRA
jgi:hypothetical protein